MKKLKKTVIAVACVVLVICVYTFLGGSKIFEGKFENDYLSWYFLAKGLFCSMTLYLLVLILEHMSAKK